MIKTWQQRCKEHPDHEGIVTERMIRERMQEEIDELRQALAQPEQEPVCFLRETAWSYEIAPWDDPNGFPVYTAPPKKEWVGLTHDEVNSWELPDCPTVFEFAQFIEAKLKEKNSGA
jgi:hypothetical protein